MKALIRLELRKQRKTFLSFLFVVIMCLTVVAANVSIFAKVSFPEIFDAFTATLQLFGLPLFGLLFGAGSGAALRRSERKAEEDIPVPASKRVFAAYITSLIYLIVLSSILFAPSILSSIFHIRELPPHILFISILPIHTASFVFSYLFSQALIGGIAAMTATGTFTFVIYLNHGLFLPAFESPVEILISFLAISLVPLLLISDFDVSLFLVAVGVILSIVIQLGLLFWISKKIEGEKQTWLPKALAAILVSSSLSLSIWSMILLGNAYDQVFFVCCH